MQDSSGAPSDTAQQMKDKMFVRNAAQGGLAEVALGKLAAGKGASEDVKAFGQKMVEDHGKLNEEMGQLADSIGARIPKKVSKEQQAQYDKLNSLSGEEFDKEYIACMMRDHHQDLREFRMEASSTNDPDVQEAVDKAAQVIREHMVTIDKMARERGIPMPGHHRPPATAASPEAPPPSQ
jgi:putative membrane protein